MKYAIIIPDGCADEPQDSLGGRTPLQAADLPAMDAVAAAGVVGRANNVPRTLPPGSDVANLSLLGYDPLTYYTGRAPLEAAAQDIELAEDDWAIRCNLVCIEDQVMRDFTAGHISTEEAAALLETAQEHIGSEHWQFYPGVSYRNLLIYRAKGRPSPFTRETRTTPPHDLTDQTVIDDFPRGPGCDVLVEMMAQSETLFADHPVNQARRRAGKLPATHIWLWGLGGAPKLPPFKDRFGVDGAMITAVDLLRGLAKLAGWRCIEVPGATGYLDTDYAAKGKYAVDALQETDVVCIHVEATDEASHEGNTEAKIEALQRIDECIVGPVFEALRKAGEYRILVSPDHPTPLRIKTHSHGFVPFAVAGTGIEPDDCHSCDEAVAERSKLVFEEGWRLMTWFMGRTG
ncbi:cofactor-independent phosphoglycerate mutase [Thermostilla marina]